MLGSGGTFARKAAGLEKDDAGGLPESRDSDPETLKGPPVSGRPVDLGEARRAEVLWNALVYGVPEARIARATAGGKRTEETAAPSIRATNRAGDQERDRLAGGGPEERRARGPRDSHHRAVDGGPFQESFILS